MMFNWLSMITGVFYIVLGVVVIIYKFFIITLDPNLAYPLGALLIIYGIFRIFRAIYRIKNDGKEN
ncbi:C4-dicarboxylate ABC transporter [uncultured Chryseobacterium sp.]|uniref:C4-dicarboxylate ABC transporter n=1 Tax=uncultured Chryseobacterium sp. TaxID=259322 RepID=UPI0026069AD7|nr:C4-dicarboxylate ABC transporter [uncultured Chryseobacterium sp.]